MYKLCLCPCTLLKYSYSLAPETLLIDISFYQSNEYLTK